MSKKQILFFYFVLSHTIKEKGGYKMNNDNIEIKFSTKHLPFEYKWLEFRLIVNKELYDEQAIDLKTYSKMQESLLSRMKKIKNEYKNIENELMKVSLT